MDEVVDPVVARRVVPDEAGDVLDEGERPGDHRVEVADADGDLAPVLPLDQAVGADGRDGLLGRGVRGDPRDVAGRAVGVVGQDQQLLRAERLAEDPARLGIDLDRRQRGAPVQVGPAPLGDPVAEQGDRRRPTRGAGVPRRGRSWSVALRSRRLASGSIGLVLRPQPARVRTRRSLTGSYPIIESENPPLPLGEPWQPPELHPGLVSAAMASFAEGDRLGVGEVRRPRPRTGTPARPSGPRPPTGRRPSAGPRRLRRRPRSGRRG